MFAQKCMQIDATDAREKNENVKNDAICHVTRQNQYNPAGGGATIRMLELQPSPFFTDSLHEA